MGTSEIIMALPQGFVLEQEPASESTLPAGFQLEKASEQPSEVSTMDRMFGAGSPIARTIKGAVVDPLLAVNQMAANTGFFGTGVKEGANQLVRNVESATTEGRARVGSTGFDPYQLLGNIVSPANKVVGLTQVAAKGVLPIIARSGTTGAGLAALSPVAATDDQFATKKLEQMGTGLLLGPLVEGGMKSLGFLADLVKGLNPASRSEYLRKHLNELAGPERAQVIEALRTAKELVSGSRPTAAEALADIPSAVELIAAQNKLANKTGIAGKFVERTTEQQAARVRSLQGIARTDAERAAVAAERDTVTGKMREEALNQSNVAGPIYTKLEREISDGFNSLAAAEQTTGMVGAAARTQQSTANLGKPGWLTAGDIAEDASKRASAYSKKADTLRKNVQLKQYQLNSLETNGFFPLKASDLVDSINSATKGTNSDMSKAVLQGVKDKILSRADENGILNSRDLYENVRKTLNDDIAKYLGQGEQFAKGGIPEQAAKAAGSVKKFIDASLDKSSDGLWSKYLKTYSAYSNKLNRMEVGDYLVKKLQAPLEKERAGVFATAVENAAGTIKKSTGIPRFDKLSDVLTDQEVGAVNSVLADLKRSSKAQELAKKVGTLEEGLPNIAKEIPSYLNSAVSTGRAAVTYLQRGNAQEFNKEMATLMLNPVGMAQFMTSGVKQGKINEFVSAMMKLMDEPTKTAFIQSFVIPSAAQEVGQ